jgi:uncharacterized protein with PIN domain
MTEEPRKTPPVRFLADDHVRRLARWLRSAGFDTFWEADIPNRELYRLSWVEKRSILTLDRKLWAPRLLRLSSRSVSAQFREVMEHFGLDPFEFAFTRCVVCNVPLERIAKEEVDAKIPYMAFDHHDTYKFCPSCERVFWRGTHTERTLRFFEEATGLIRPERFATPEARS